MRAAYRHIGHKHHLCSLVTDAALSLAEIKTLTRNAKYVCRTCGRSAVYEGNLCHPEPFDFICGGCGQTFMTQTELLRHTCISLG